MRRRSSRQRLPCGSAGYSENKNARSGQTERALRRALLATEPRRKGTKPVWILRGGRRGGCGHVASAGSAAASNVVQVDDIDGGQLGVVLRGGLRGLGLHRGLVVVSTIKAKCSAHAATQPGVFVPRRGASSPQDDHLGRRFGRRDLVSELVTEPCDCSGHGGERSAGPVGVEPTFVERPGMLFGERRLSRAAVARWITMRAQCAVYDGLRAMKRASFPLSHAQSGTSSTTSSRTIS